MLNSFLFLSLFNSNFPFSIDFLINTLSISDPINSKKKKKKIIKKKRGKKKKKKKKKKIKKIISKFF